MRAREFQPADYPMVLDWWNAGGWPAGSKPTLEFLPQSGWIVENDSGLPICAGWLYTGDTPLAWFDWLVANPASKLRERPAGIEYLLDTVDSFGKEMGVKRIIGSMKTKSLVKLFSKKGWITGDTGMIHLIRSLE